MIFAQYDMKPHHPNLAVPILVAVSQARNMFHTGIESSLRSGRTPLPWVATKPARPSSSKHLWRPVFFWALLFFTVLPESLA